MFLAFLGVVEDQIAQADKRMHRTGSEQFRTSALAAGRGPTGILLKRNNRCMKSANVGVLRLKLAS